LDPSPATASGWFRALIGIHARLNLILSSQSARFGA
jgi:hypothetical protein